MPSAASIRSIPGTGPLRASGVGKGLTAALAMLCLAVGATAQERIENATDASNIGTGDVWIATLGDSFASGEGNPNNVGVPFNDWKWIDDDKCHRSKHAWPVQVARHYEDSDQFTNPVAHSFLACSGSSIDRGLLGSYTANWPALSPETHDAQLDQLAAQAKAAGRVPNVVLISSGGNDIGFSDIVRDCAWGDCPGGLANEDEVRNRMNALSGANGRYARVAARLDEIGVPADDVYLLIYPSPLEGKKRQIFGGWGPKQILAACWVYSGEDSWRWAQREVIEPLQSIQRQEASRAGWHVIDRHLDDFETHSYCPRHALPGADSWWVGITTTISRQWGVGAFHPNRRGHDAISNVASDDIEPDVPEGWVFEEPEEETLPDQAMDWVGTYTGRYDGRRAELRIEVANQRTELRITLAELERDEQASDTVGAYRFGGGEPVHVIEELTLTNGGCTTWGDPDVPCVIKNIPLLLLHTWDNDHISGYSRWNDIDFGLSFSRDGLPAAPPDTGRLDPSDWAGELAGRYEGRLDGRNARLEITEVGRALNITLEDLDRGVTFTETVSISSQAAPHEHILTDLRLISEGGMSKEIEKLFLHTWDTGYLSGVTRWRGIPHGSWFVKER